MTAALAAGLIHSLWMGCGVALATAALLTALPQTRPRLRLHISAVGLGILLAMPIGFVAGGGPAVPHSPWTLGLSLAWGAGAMVGLIRVWNSQRAVWRLRRRAYPATAAWQARVETCAAALGLCRAVPLLISPDRDTPCTLGVLRPVIILPDNHLRHLDRSTWDAIVGHELFHVARRHYAWHLLQAVATAFVFYHPAAWWLTRQIDREREASCDQGSAFRVGPAVLAASLATLERRRPGRASTGSATHLLSRVQRLVGARPAAVWRGTLTWATLAAGGVGWAAYVALGFESPLLSSPTPWLTAVGLGLAIGLRHAVEPDHLVAVATLITRERGLKSAVHLGASWGVGHTVALLAGSAGLILARRAMPDAMGEALQVAVACTLIAMGARTLVDAWRANVGGPVTRHSHGAVTHTHASVGEHVHIGGLALATRPLLVGLVHGLAGSGALTALAVASLPSWQQQLSFLAVFGAGSALGMALLSGLAGWPLAHLVRSPRTFSLISAGAGAVSIVFGLAWSGPTIVHHLLR